VDSGIREIARLVGGRDWAVGDRFSLGDIAVGTVVRFLDVRFPEIPWRTLYPGLAALSDRLEVRPSFLGSVPAPQIISDPVV